MSAMHDLVAQWRREAETLERREQGSTGKLIRRLAVEVEEALRHDEDEALTLAEAALESNYSTEHLRKLVAAGTIPNAGEKGRPQIRRSDLPTRSTNGKGHVGSPEDDARTFLSERGEARGT